MEKITNAKMTQTEFNALKRNEIGYLVIPDGTDCTEINFDAVDRVIFGDCCKLGNGCELGVQCVLGMCFDKHAAFEDARATFEDGRVQDGLYMQYGSIGSDHRTFSFYIDKNETMFVRAGCWFSGMDEFKTRVKDAHGGTTEAQYMAACDYAEMQLLPRLMKSDARRNKKK